MTMTNALHVNSISLLIDTHKILNNIHLTIATGSCYGILGPNGSGKTSLLRCMYGSLLPSSGNIHLLDRPLQDYSRVERSQRMAVVLQEMDSELALSVAEILRLGRLPYQSLFNIPRDGFDEYEHYIIDELGLKQLLNRIYRRLSGGEKQRVMLARALFQKPTLLFLDEPTNHLDISHQLSLMNYVSDLNITVICSLHDLNLASRYCDKVAVLNDGNLVAEGHPDTVLTEALISQVYAVRSFRFNNPNIQKYSLDFY